MPDRISSAAAGEHVKFHNGSEELEWEVQPACDTKQGHWICVTHDESFATQLAKDGHIRTGTHVLAWVCHEHGVVEAP